MRERAATEAGTLSRTGGSSDIFLSFFFFFSLFLSHFLLSLPWLSSSLYSLHIPGPFRAEGGTARNEAARAVAAPRGGVAVDLCSSTSASTVSRSGREADEGLFFSREHDEANCWPRERRKTKFC